MNRVRKESSFVSKNEDLSEFLKPTYLVDSCNPKIIEKARELARNCKTDVEKAKVLFEFVRDAPRDDRCKSLRASSAVGHGIDLSCAKRAIFLAALCRAAGVPARLHLQKCGIKKWKKPDGEMKDITFVHWITGIYLNGHWRLYESVGNKEKWIQWTQDEKRGLEMPVKFCPDRGCLFKSDEKITIENLPTYGVGITEEMLGLENTLNDM